MALAINHQYELPETDGVDAAKKQHLNLVESSPEPMPTIDPAELAVGDSITIHSIADTYQFTVTRSDEHGNLDGNFTLLAFGKQPTLYLNGNRFVYMQTEVTYQAQLKRLARIQDGRRAQFYVSGEGFKTVSFLTQEIIDGHVEHSSNNKQPFSEAYLEDLEEIMGTEYVDRLRDAGFMAIDAAK